MHVCRYVGVMYELYMRMYLCLFLCVYIYIYMYTHTCKSPAVPFGPELWVLALRLLRLVGLRLLNFRL